MTSISQASLPASAQPEPFSAYIPVHAGCKLPVNQGWQFTQPGQAKPDGNYGTVAQDDEIIIDSDPRNFPAGREVLQELWDAHLETAPTRYVKTPSGGYHFYFRNRTGKKFRKTQAAWPGIDFLSKGAQAVGPGSVLVDGSKCTVYGCKKDHRAGAYELLSGDAPIADLPESLAAILQEKSETEASTVPDTAHVSLLGEPDFKIKCQSYPAAVQGENGDDTTYILACQGRDLGLPQERAYQIMAEHFNPRCTPPWPLSDLKAKVRHAYRYAKGTAGAQSPEAKFVAPPAPPVKLVPPPPSVPGADTACSTVAPAYKTLWQRRPEFEVPSGFELKESGSIADGVYRWNDKDEAYNIYVCDPVLVSSETRGINGEALDVLVLEAKTRHGEVKTVNIPLPLLQEQSGVKLAQTLAIEGFNIEPGKAKDLAVYLSRCRPFNKSWAVTRTGWAISEDDMLRFVFPDGATDPNYVFMGASQLRKAMRPAGTLDDWNRSVFDEIKGIPVAIYEVLKAVAAPLYRFIPSVEIGAEHCYCVSSQGKTTLMQIGASVSGCGSVPSKAQNAGSYIMTWDQTEKALTEKLDQYNDPACLPLDEIGTYTGSDLGSTVYNPTGAHIARAYEIRLTPMSCTTNGPGRHPLLSTGEMVHAPKGSSGQGRVWPALTKMESGMGVRVWWTG